ncbi:uncharacterized protein N7446_007693 [Penicillium canescens]|uniref:Zn(2)-C6 fungal-type domain-containing protein n=1 Tax=Penicillium canescens TaxID=5083 RepID=A0AAD6NDM0_PENCN|nr:uncharacterized protein N7446_007693 [Penicillium canescens]KAJ6034010.1 hypothetical protein N7444_011781 [Penicillium canescens]KAJ6056802.1 hypothetical protein N7460_000076 [Penicillium canescens]KAJ6058110.1 hypothetical protein N7446_007693 [Penicillium canescens]
MVGRPRSQGCENCRKRKKKVEDYLLAGLLRLFLCGREEPKCIACEKAGWICPGYLRQWKFVDQTDAMAKLYSKKWYIFEENYLDCSKTPSNSQETVLWDLNLHLVGEKISSVLVYLLENPRSQAIFPLASHGSFYSIIPSRLGHNAALDSAVSCMCNVFIHFMSGQSKATAAIIEEYVKSLQTLRGVLDNPRLRRHAETLCASIILQLCELLLNKDFGQWIDLCQGSKRLIEERGPNGFPEQFERELLESQQGFIPSFLAQPDWRHLMDNLDNGIAVRLQLCSQLLDVPVLLAEASSVLARQLTRAEPCLFEIKDITSRMLTQHDKFEAWYLEQRWPRPIDNTLSDSTQPLYPNLLYAVFDFLSNLILIVMERVYYRLIDFQPVIHRQGSAICPTARHRARQELMDGAISFVKRYSRAAAKPIEYEAQRLRNSGLAIKSLW